MEYFNLPYKPEKYFLVLISILCIGTDKLNFLLATDCS